MSSKQDNHDKSNTPKSKRKKQKKKKNRSDDDEPELDEKLDNEKFQKMLGDMFPSNHQNKKINDIKKKKKIRKQRIVIMNLNIIPKMIYPTQMIHY